MYRCKECQAEYDVKPDYCDCGNDTFIEVSEHKEEPTLSKVEPIKDIILESPKSSKVVRKKQSEISLYAWIIFSLCSILSVLIIFVIGNPKNEVTPEVIKETKEVGYIPNSTAKFWDNTISRQQEVSVAEVPKPIVEQVFPKIVQQKPVQKVQTPVQKVQNTVKNTAKQPVQATVKTNSSSVSKPAVQNAKAAQNTGASLPKSVTDIVNKPKTSSTPSVSQPQKNVQPKAEVKKLNPQEYANYKINLRNRIASKINFAGVVGDGDCIVSFAVSSTGSLINRKFDKQSTNNTLNDAVYHAIMQTPSFNTPPEGYNGQVMKFTVKMYNGSFEVTLN